MRSFSDFLTDTRGSAFDKIAITCAVISLVCVLGAHGIDRMAQSGNLPTLAFHHDERAPNVDYTATASIPRRVQGVTLDPCTGQTR
jgi:hypothetical protein